MVVFSHYPLQKAIYQALSGNAALTALAGVYDRPVQGAPFPYLSFSGWEGRDWSSATTSGMAFTLVIEVWSRAGGHSEAARIMEQVHAALHEAAPAVEGQTLVLLRFSDSVIAPEADGSTYRGVMRLQALVQS